MSFLGRIIKVLSTTVQSGLVDFGVTRLGSDQVGCGFRYLCCGTVYVGLMHTGIWLGRQYTLVALSILRNRAMKGKT